MVSVPDTTQRFSSPGLDELDPEEPQPPRASVAAARAPIAPSSLFMIVYSLRATTVTRPCAGISTVRPSTAGPVSPNGSADSNLTPSGSDGRRTVVWRP